MSNTASSIHPLSALYNRLNSKLVDEDEKKVQVLLRGRQISERDLEKLQNPAAIFQHLEERGHISWNNLSLLKGILQEIDRQPLIELVTKCEETLKTNSRMSAKTRPAVSGRHNVGDGPACSEISLPVTHREMTRTLVKEVENLGANDSGERSDENRERMRDKTPVLSDVVYRCQMSLQETYHQLSFISPFPWWDGTERLKLEDVYTELELQTKDGKKTKIAKADMFSPRDDCFTPRRIIIEGDPGYGKTTFCKKLAFDWASKKSGYLNRFKMVILLELRNLFEYHRTNPDKQCLIDVISDLLLDLCDQDKSDLWNYIQHNQSEICIIFDGLDEVPALKLPGYFRETIKQTPTMLKNSVVIVTSRKIRDKISKQHYDTQLCIKGFDAVTFKEFVKKHFKATHASEGYSSSFATETFLRKLDDLADEHILGDLSKSPLMALMVCDMAIENRTLPETVTKLYTCIVDIVVKRYIDKEEFREDEVAEVKSGLVILREIASNCLLKYNYEVKDEDILINPHIKKVGFLTTASKPLSSGRQKYTFCHATFQQYFAAVHVSNLCDDDPSKFSEIMEEYWSRDNSTFLKFVAGILGDNVNKLFEALINSDRFQDQYSHDDDSDDNNEHCESPYFDDSYDMLLDLLHESSSDSKESIETCVALMPKKIKLNLDNISKYNRGDKVVKEVTRRCIIRPDAESLIIEINVINEKTRATFENLSTSLMTDDFKLKKVLFVNYTCFQIEWLSFKLHQIRELQVFDVPYDFSDIVPQVLMLHSKHKLLDTVVLRSKYAFDECDFKVFVRKRDTDSTNECCDEYHVSFISESHVSIYLQNYIQTLMASLESIKSTALDEMDFGVTFSDFDFYCASDVYRDINNILENVQSVNAKKMSIDVCISSGLDTYSTDKRINFDTTSSLEQLNPTSEKSKLENKSLVSVKLYHSVQDSFSELREFLSYFEHIAIDRFVLICANPDDEYAEVNQASDEFTRTLDSLSRFQASHVFFTFPLFRFDLMKTVRKTFQRKDLPSVDVTFVKEPDYENEEIWGLLKFQINVQCGKYTFHFTSLGKMIDFESLNQAVSDLVSSKTERVSIEIIYDFNQQEIVYKCGLMGMALSMPTLDSQMIKKVVSIHNGLILQVSYEVQSFFYDYRDYESNDDMFIFYFDQIREGIDLAKNVCREYCQVEMIKLIEQEVASDMSFVQRIKLSRCEICVIGKCQQPIITQTREIEEGLVLFCQFLDRAGVFSVDDDFSSLNPRDILFFPLDEIYSDLCRVCENNPQTQSMCLTCSEEELVTCNSVIEQIVNLTYNLRHLHTIDILDGDFAPNEDDFKLWVKLLKKELITNIAFHRCYLDNAIDILTTAIHEADDERQCKLIITICDSLEIDNARNFRDKLSESKFEISTVDNSCLEGANISVNIENASIQCSCEL